MTNVRTGISSDNSLSELVVLLVILERRAKEPQKVFSRLLRVSKGGDICSTGHLCVKLLGLEVREYLIASGFRTRHGLNHGVGVGS